MPHASAESVDGLLFRTRGAALSFQRPHVETPGSPAPHAACRTRHAYNCVLGRARSIASALPTYCTLGDIHELLPRDSATGAFAPIIVTAGGKSGLGSRYDARAVPAPPMRNAASSGAVGPAGVRGGCVCRHLERPGGVDSCACATDRARRFGRPVERLDGGHAEDRQHGVGDGRPGASRRNRYLSPPADRGLGAALLRWGELCRLAAVRLSTVAAHGSLGAPGSSAIDVHRGRIALGFARSSHALRRGAYLSALDQPGVLRCHLRLSRTQQPHRTYHSVLGCLYSLGQ